MSLTDLPNEILELILLQTPQNGIKKLTTACPKFRDVIEGSIRLMDQIPVYWCEKGQEDLLKSNRKYRKLHIGRVKGISPELQRFIYQQSRTLTEIRFYEPCKLKSSEIGQILEVTAANLKEFWVIDSYYEIIIDSIMKPINFRTLDTLKLLSSSWLEKSILPFFKHANLKTFELQEACDLPFDFQQYLVSLARVTHLTLERDAAKTFFNNFSRTSRHRMKLKELSIDGTFLYEGVLELTKFFLKSQRKTLKTIELRHFEIKSEFAKTILGTNVKRLNLHECDYSFDDPIGIINSSIKYLDFQSFDIRSPPEESYVESCCKFIQCCVNVETINVKSYVLNLSKNILETISEIESLRKLVIRYYYIQYEYLNDSSYIFATVFPFIKELTITLHRSDSDKDFGYEGFNNNLTNGFLAMVYCNLHIPSIKISDQFEENSVFEHLVKYRLMPRVSFTPDPEIKFRES